MKYLLLALAAAGLAAAQTAPTFYNARPDYLVSGAFAIADFNGDGYPDIAASDANDTIVIYLNDGKGKFNKFASIAGSPASYLVAGDFNNDGIPDIAFIVGENVGIVLGAGDGTLRDYYVDSDVYAYGSDLVAADMNLDGKLDVVVGDYVIYGNGDGTLGAATSTGCSSPFDVKDMNGDGYPDIVCSSYNDTNDTYQVQVVFNYGTGTLQAGPSVAMPGGSPNSIALGDVNGDGTNDVVAVNSQDFAVFLNNGKGQLTQSNVYSLTLPSDDVKLADVNGDGRLDALFSRNAANGLYPAQNLIIWKGNGDGSFSASATYATAGDDYRIVLADLRKTGRQDIVTGNTSYFSTLFNFGNDTFDDGQYVKITDTRLGAAVSADFNHDGIPDLAVSVLIDAKSPKPSNNQLSGAYILLGTGKPNDPFTTGQRLFVPPNVDAIATGDFNNDGNPDLAFLTGQRLVIYLGNGDGTFSMGAAYASSAVALTVGDFNNDGNLDIATNGVYIFNGNGDGTFIPRLGFIAVGPEILSADLNGDGNLDLIATLENGEEFEVALGKGDGTFKPPVRYNASSESIAVADFTGSGFPDIALLSNYSIDLWNNSAAHPGTFTRGNSVPFITSTVPVNLVAADFNGDGIPDLATAAVDLQILSGTGMGTFGPPQIYGGADYPNFLLAGKILLDGTHLPSVITVGSNTAISFFSNTTK